MTYQTHLELGTDTVPKTPWKYRLAYVFMTLVLMRMAPKGTSSYVFLGMIIIYPFAMSFLSLRNGNLLNNEFAHLHDRWKVLPMGGKAGIIALISTLVTGPISTSHVVPEFFTQWIMYTIIGYPISYAIKRIKKAQELIKDQL